MSATLSLHSLSTRFKPRPIIPNSSPKSSSKRPIATKPFTSDKTQFSKHSNTPKNVLLRLQDHIRQFKPSTLPVTALTLPFFLDPQEALAIDGQFGLLEGRTFSLIHPVVMGGLFFYTLWAGYLGWQWRRVRTIQDEINDLKKLVKPSPVAVPEGAAPAEAPDSVSPTEAKIQQLTEERKALIKGSYRERHFNAGSILLGFGVFQAVGGGVNTWFRTGKLFPGPHLFAGAAITVLWAVAASLVPAMQKGNETARSLHITLNALNVLLFISQIPTGIEILFKVLEFTKWP